MQLPNIWNLFNLQANPFFQDQLQPGEPPVYPLELFVGREAALSKLLQGIGGATSSRQVIAGVPGVGKTTLAQRVKAAALEAGYVTNPAEVGLTAEDTTSALLVRILANVYEAVFATLGSAVQDAPPLVEARHIVQAFRSTDWSGGVGGAVSVSAGRSRSHVPPVVFDAPHTVARVLRELERLACLDHKRRGILVHVNNFENLTGSGDFERAGMVLRDVRDIFLLHNFHWLVVGTTEALSGTLLVHPQVASVFPSPEPLEPLSETEFVALLARRYEHLRVDSRKPVVQPVSDEAATAVYRLFEGDLRGTLRALQEAAEALVGYARDPFAPLDAPTIMAALRPRYQARFDSWASNRLREQFAAIAPLRDEVFTQEDLRKIWKVSAARVSQVVKPLQVQGYIMVVGRRGPQNLYRLTGAGRLALP